MKNSKQTTDGEKKPDGMNYLHAGEQEQLPCDLKVP